MDGSRKIWLDTDIGNDIDDSVALAYLLKKPECDLLGISTVSGQPVERAKIADALCRAAGKDIPIFPGLEEPLMTPQRQSEPHQTKYLVNWEHRKDFKTGYAIEAMYEAISQNPGMVTLLAIGPMTNIALLFKVHPDVSSLLSDVVVMCGEFFGKSRYLRCENEWNSFCDPYSASILYETKGVRIRSVGLDVTSKVMMEYDEIKERFTSPLLKTVYDFGGFECNERTDITFHDPLAAVSIFRPEIMEYLMGKVSVELQGGRVAGRTYFDETQDGLHEVGVTVDVKAFYNEYFNIVNERG